MQRDLNRPNRRMRTRTSGGVGGAQRDQTRCPLSRSGQTDRRFFVESSTRIAQPVALCPANLTPCTAELVSIPRQRAIGHSRSQHRPKVVRSTATSELHPIAVSTTTSRKSQTVREAYRDDRPPRDGVSAYSKPDLKVALRFVERMNNKIRVFQRCACGLSDQEYLRLKVLSCTLPEI